jgi:hypothetical protein
LQNIIRCKGKRIKRMYDFLRMLRGTPEKESQPHVVIVQLMLSPDRLRTNVNHLSSGMMHLPW